MQVDLLGGEGRIVKENVGMARRVSCSPLFSSPAATHRWVSLDRSPTSEGIAPDNLFWYRYLPAHRRNKGRARCEKDGSMGATAS